MKCALILWAGAVTLVIAGCGGTAGPASSPPPSTPASPAATAAQASSAPAAAAGATIQACVNLDAPDLTMIDDCIFQTGTTPAVENCVQTAAENDGLTAGSDHAKFDADVASCISAGG